jgi:hypothetical protein
MRTDGRTDMAKPIVAFRNFAEAPEITQGALVILVILMDMSN